jgi:uncharacterized membrane protein YbaN (DUF454 family)
MINIPVEWLVGVVFALIALAAFYDLVVSPWLYERERRRFYKRMKEREPYED